jgi:hypothetical protein
VVLSWLFGVVLAAVAALSGAEPGNPGSRDAGRFGSARDIDRATSVGVPAAGRPAVLEPGRGRLGLAAPAIDTGAVSAFGAAADERGRLWLAVAGRDARLRVLRSDDSGANWDELFQFRPGTDVPKVEVVTGPGDSGCVFVFYLTVAQAGDLRALRIGPGDSLGVLDFEVAVGPETITSFAAAADRDRHYYLYCLYANELRAGRNGAFTRSLDFGKSWEIPQGWWNCWDPCVAYGSGSTVHCAWRYAANGREIHVETSRYYGRPRSWWGHWRVSKPAARCAEPTVAQLDTSHDGRAAAWVAWTVADRHDRRRDVEVARSDDGGAGWMHAGPPGDEPWLDRWAPVLAAAPGRPFGPVQLACVAGRAGADTTDAMPDKTLLSWRTTTHATRGSWSAPAGAGGGPLASGAGVKPRMIVAAGAPRGWPLFIYSRRSPTGARGLYASALWLGDDLPPDRPAPAAGGPRVVRSGRGLRLDPAPAGPVRLSFFDAAGRRIGQPLTVGAGADAVSPDFVLPAGPVFVRVTGGSGTATARVTAVR